MTSFFNNMLPTGLHLPSLPNPMSFLSRPEEEETPEDADSSKLQLDIPDQKQQQSQHREGQQHNGKGEDHHDHAMSDSETHDDHGSRKKKQPSETFIIVRPPPAKNNHPLNLQIQLIPPNLQTQRQRRSVELSRDDMQTPATPDSAASAISGNSLGRRPSVRSDRSASLYSVATSSVTSLASTVSGRRVVPLYNLSAHNVMQNTVVDAGTDAKVAKFLKKGLEVAQVAYLEPIEFWERFSEDLLDSRGTRASDNGHGSQIEAIREYTPRSSFSQDRHPRTSTTAAIPQPELLSPPLPEQKKQKKAFGKLFKRRNESISELSAVQPPPSPARSEIIPASPSMSAMDSQLLTPTLGLQPAQGSKMASHDHNRAVSYVWIVKKWLKPTGETWLNKGLNNLRMGGPSQTDSLASVDLRFEWTRANDHNRRGRRRSIAEGTDSAVPSARNSMVAPGDTTGLAPPFTYERSPTPSMKRGSVSPRASAMLLAPVATSAETSSTNSQSDSEDDDTPWTCILHVSPHHAKMRVAALIPAPHHPKLLGQVKIPFPLPDVAVERGEFLPRVDGMESTEDGLLLTAEDIKDIIASTCLWLVVRESFGGIDKKRKGDGWRIRS